MRDDPLRVIAVESPGFSASDAVEIARDFYGLAVTAEELVSERDRNFHLRTRDGREFVLKIASAAEDPLVTDFQVQALRFLETNAAHVPVPRLVPARDGQLILQLPSRDGVHVARLVTYLPGVLLSGKPLTPRLCRNFGVFAAGLGRALSAFDHPGSNQCLVWNMNETARVREITHHIPDLESRREVNAVLDHFQSQVLPEFSALRTQVLHNDLNPENVLLDPDDHSKVIGAIDFGDMVRCPLVVDVAVAASYMRSFDADPLTHAATFIGAYHEVTPLVRDEIDLVFDLLCVRLAITVSVLHWRIAVRGEDDPYLNNSLSAESTAGKFLHILSSIPREHARQVLRQACASVEVAREREFS